MSTSPHIIYRACCPRQTAFSRRLRSDHLTDKLKRILSSRNAPLAGLPALHPALLPRLPTACSFMAHIARAPMAEQMNRAPATPESPTGPCLRDAKMPTSGAVRGAEKWKAPRAFGAIQKAKSRLGYIAGYWGAA